MILSIAFGILLAIATIVIHAVSSSYLIGELRRRTASFQARFGELKALVLTAVWLLVTHIVETGIWAIAYCYLVGGEKFTNFEDSAYFSTVTFTTLGYGDIVIEGHWRMLSACQAMTGLLVFGWSTALLFAVVERVWKRKFDEG